MLDYLLELMRNEFSCERSSQFESLTLSERISLLSLGRRLKVFPLLYRYIKNIYPDDSLSDFDSLYYHQHVLANNQLEMLRQFADVCANEKMRFVAYKGVALSWLVYGEVEARQIGDIDILVDKHDVSRCHYCLSEIGFRQVVQQPEKRIDSVGKERLLDFCCGRNSPYPFRRAAHDNQLAPYFHANNPVRLEVHDSIRGADEQLSRLLLWRVKTIDNCIRTFDLEASLISVILNAYSNFNTFYAKVDEELNLRDYVDFHMLLKKYGNAIDWSYLRRVIEKFDLKDICKSVYSNYRQVYGAASLEGLEEKFGFAHLSAVSFSHPVLESLRNPANEHIRILREAKAFYANAISLGCAFNIDRDGSWNKYSNPYGLEIQFRITRRNDSIVLSWLLPVEVMREAEVFYLQWFLVPCYDAPFFEYSIGLPLGTESDYATLRSLGRLGKNPKRGKLISNLGVEERSAESGFTVKSVILPFDLIGASKKQLKHGIASFPIVFMEMTGVNLFHSILAQEGEFTQNPVVYFIKEGEGDE